MFRAITFALVGGIAGASIDAATFDPGPVVYPRGSVATMTVRMADEPGVTTVRLDVEGLVTAEGAVEDAAARVTLDTAFLQPGDYTVTAHLLRDGEVIGTIERPLTVAPRHDHERLPLWLWGGYGYQMEWWIDHGFCGGFLFPIIDPPQDDPAFARYAIKRAGPLLEKAAQLDFDLGGYLAPLSSKKLGDAARIVYPDGSRATDTGHDFYPLEPTVLDNSRRVARWFAEHLGQYPAMRHALLNTEYRTFYAVNPVAVDLARREAGIDLREFIVAAGRGGWNQLDASKLRSAGNGLIEDDDPGLRFMHWWWTRGIGINESNRVMNDEIVAVRPDLLTWHDPHRDASVRQTHAGIGAVSTWTYGRPDTKRLAYTTYLHAVARGNQQKVMQTVTLFLYARYVMAMEQSTADLARDFPGKDPWFLAGPDYTQEALWISLAQRPDILGIYAPSNLIEQYLRGSTEPLDDFFTSPQTWTAVQAWSRRVLQPYGPMIRQSRRAPARVALWDSATAWWLGDWYRYTLGYASEQTLPYATLLMMNHVPFDVLYDEDIVAGALDNYDCVVIPRADTRTRIMDRALTQFIRRGGRVIVNEPVRAPIRGARTTKLDFTYQRKIDGAVPADERLTAEDDRRNKEQYAATLAPLLDNKWRHARATSPRVLTFGLDGGAAQYHFFINDDRTWGERFGSHRLMFEDGVPQRAHVAVRLDGPNRVVYDMLERQRIDYENRGGWAHFDLYLDAADAKMVAVLPEAISAVNITAPSNVRLGQRVDVTIEVTGASGQPLVGVHPLRIEVIDPNGEPTDDSRFAATRLEDDGRYVLPLTATVNATLGAYTIRVTELVANHTAKHTILFEAP